MPVSERQRLAADEAIDVDAMDVLPEDGQAVGQEPEPDVIEPDVQPTRIERLKGLFRRKPKTVSAEDEPVQADASDDPEQPKSISETAESEGDTAADEPRQGRIKALFKRRAKTDDGVIPLGVPIRVLIGFMSDVTEKDARAYALGIAGNHCENMGMARYGVQKYKGGFVYEVHEGGDGRAYLPSILKHFESLGVFSPTHPGEALIRTGTRHVQVSQTREGLVALQLVEEAEAENSPWLRASGRLRAVMPTMRGMLIAGVTVFVLGCAVTITANLGRIVPEQAVPKSPDEVIAAENTPLGQLGLLNNLQLADDDYVTALKLEKGKWRIERHSERMTSSSGTTGAPNAAATPAVPAPSTEQP